MTIAIAILDPGALRTGVWTAQQYFEGGTLVDMVRAARQHPAPLALALLAVFIGMRMLAYNARQAKLEALTQAIDVSTLVWLALATFATMLVATSFMVF